MWRQTLYQRYADQSEGCSRFTSLWCARDEILEDFPYLESEDIDACLEYAAAEVRSK